MKRIVAYDLGSVRIGIACSDPLRIIASPCETYLCRGEEQDIKYLCDFAKEKDADTMVIGLPLNLDGTDSNQTMKIREYVEKMRPLTDCKIVLVDERLSSWEAEQMLIEGDMRREKRKKVIDKIAASIILDSYMKRL